MGSTFSLTGDDGAKLFEGVDSFNCLVRVLHRSDEYWPAVHRNIVIEIQVWGSLGKFLRSEGSDLIVAEKFYRPVVQAMLLFGLETWDLTAAMLQKIEGVHMGFLRQVAGMTDQNMGSILVKGGGRIWYSR